MHLLIPHASALDERCRLALESTPLPMLDQLMAWMAPEGDALGGDEYAPDTPQELALARAWGWQGQPGALPFAADLASQHGIDVGRQAWALLSPIHLSIGSDQVMALPPEYLSLSADESRLLFDTLAELWPEQESWRRLLLSPTQWLLSHDSLDGLSAASLDRIALRSIEPWLPQDRLLRRLQNEIQMLLHGHPVNAARELRGQRAVNAVWFSACGRAQPRAPGASPKVDDRLRLPLLQGDWSAWREAWMALDAGPVADMLSLAQKGRTDLRLTLCGERWAQTLVVRPTAWWQQLWQRWRAPQLPARERLVAL